MFSHSQASGDVPEMASTRQPWVEMSISRASTLPRFGSRIVAFNRSAVRLARRRSGWCCCLADSLMVESYPRTTDGRGS
jgi:hypothetical protein